MISKIMLFLILTVFINTIKTSTSNTYYTNLHLSDTVKLINRNPNKSTQIYFFTDLSACHICNFNINELSKQYRNECDFYVFINKENNSDIVSLKSIFDDNINLIGDEYGIYKEYNKIKYQPLILVLDFNGIVIGWDNIKSIELDLDIIIENNKQQYTNSKILRKNYELQEISRLRVKNNNEELVTSLFRECLFNEKEKGFVLINMRQPEIQIIDSTGIIQKIIKLFGSVNSTLSIKNYLKNKDKLIY